MSFGLNIPYGLIYKYDVSIAKNYLNENELKKLNNLTTLSSYYAQNMAEDEYEKFRIKRDKEYISSMNGMYKKFIRE